MSLTTSIFVAGRGAGAVGAKAVPAPIPVRPEPVEAVAPRLVEISPQDQSRPFLLEADNSPDPVIESRDQEGDHETRTEEGRELRPLREAVAGSPIGRRGILQPVLRIST